MKFLKALATPFVKLWNWIKQTAWVQPLLIVGCIFAVIFSIPYIAKGVENMNKGSEDKMAYYKDNLISLKKSYKEESDADKFFESYLAAEDQYNNPELVEKDKVDAFAKKYGEKFFFTFVGSDCEPCHENVKAFKELKDNAKDYGLDGKYKFHSMIIDQKVGDKDKYKEKSAFEFAVEHNVAFFASSIYEAGRVNYYSKNLTDNADYMSKIESLATTIKTVNVPVIMVFDTTEKNTTGSIISQIFFDIEGDTTMDKAKSLRDAWNYTGKVFGPKESL